MNKNIQQLIEARGDLDLDYNKILVEMSENLKIDIYNLEENCATHSEHFHSAALLASGSTLLVNKADLLSKELKAEIAIDVRSDPEKYGIVKVTENQISEAVDCAEEIKDVKRLWVECVWLKNKCDALVEAFEHRRSMLNNEVQLYMSKLSEPKVEVKRKDIENTITDRKRVRRLNDGV